MVCWAITSFSSELFGRPGSFNHRGKCSHIRAVVDCMGRFDQIWEDFCSCAYWCSFDHIKSDVVRLITET